MPGRKLFLCDVLHTLSCDHFCKRGNILNVSRALCRYLHCYVPKVLVLVLCVFSLARPRHNPVILMAA